MSDRHLPANLEAERAILGAALQWPESLATAVSVVQPEDFFRDAHQRIFRAMLTLRATDPVTVKDALSKSGDLDAVGGPMYLAGLMDGVPRSSNVEHYAGIVRDAAVLRGTIAACTRALASAYEASDPQALVVDQAFSDLLALSSKASGTGLRPVRDHVAATLRQIEALSDPDSAAWGHRSGLQSLDRKLRGCRPGKMIVIAGRPGDGKTSFALNLATAVARKRVPVGVFSVESDESEMMLHLISAEARVNIEDLADGKFSPDDWRRVSEAVSLFGEIPLFTDYTTDLSPVTLRAKARQMQIRHGLGLVVIDYVQLMQGLPTAKKHENEHEKLTGISRAIKLLAKDLAVPIVVCCQLNRSPESRFDGRPQLGDLRGSGSLEQDADVVILIHDPSKTPKKKSGFRRKGEESAAVEAEMQRGLVELIVAKNRGLSTGVVRVLFRKEFTRFENLAM
jgi:replicative DNA helicase